jgi:murein DD-endopeptidase MepM/ murein hydrolase activator NlpD
MNSKQFSKNVLFSQEIKANNTIEGYNDDVGLVYDILNKNIKISDKEKEQRIRNLYNGYNFILNEDQINKENLRTLDFEVPLENPIITSRFGWRSSGYHYGIDLAAPMGADITAAEDGVVTYADWCGNYGYLIKVQHSGGYETYYAHCSKIIAQVGDEVQKDQLIGLVGSTGRSSGPHVHMEIRYEGTPLNPEVFLYD